MFQSSDSRNTSVKTLEGVFVTQSAKRADKNVEKPLFVVEFPVFKCVQHLCNRLPQDNQLIG